MVHSWTPHDADQPWGSDPAGMSGVLDALGGNRDHLQHAEADFAKSDAPAFVIDRAVHHFGHVDVVVANHARSAVQTLADVTAAELDLSWAVNARASVLLTQAFAAQHNDEKTGGRVILFTSGQHLAPMSQEIPYAISKGAIQQMTLSLSDALVDRGITVNAINPGPTDTGWASSRPCSAGAKRPAGWSMGIARRRLPACVLAGFRRQRLDHRAGHQFRRWIPPLENVTLHCRAVFHAGAILRRMSDHGPWRQARMTTHPRLTRKGTVHGYTIRLKLHPPSLAPGPRHWKLPPGWLRRSDWAETTSGSNAMISLVWVAGETKCESWSGSAVPRWLVAPTPLSPAALVRAITPD